MQKSTDAALSNKYTRDAAIKMRGLGLAAPKTRLDGGDDVASSGTTGWKSGGGDVSYRDAVLPPAQKRISREQLDKQLITSVTKSQDRYLRNISDEGLTTLERSCLRVVAQNVGEKVMQDSLLSTRLPLRFAENLCRRVKKQFKGRDIPFSVWQLLQSLDPDAIPPTMRTYTGLVFDDVDELNRLNTTYNTTLLDLSNTAFQKTDIYRIRMSFSNSLVALRLDHLTHLDDDTITALSRDVGAEEGKAFGKLEVLTLRGCKSITDKSAPKFARFTALKMLGAYISYSWAVQGLHTLCHLDLRGTSCTTATKDILRQLTKPPYISAFTPIQLSLFACTPLDQTYRQYSRAINTPLVKNAEDLSEAASSALDDPCVLVTALTRLDDTKVLDPRIPTAKNRFVASHHIYGNVYTSVPINNEALKDDGLQESSKGSAFRHGRHLNVMGGRLPISQADVGWKRFATKRKAAHLLANAVIDVDDDEDVGDSDLDLSEEEGNQKPCLEREESTTEDATLSAFYRQPVQLGETPEEPIKVPLRHPLMLLRFFKRSSAEIHSIFPAQAEVYKPKASTSAVTDDQAAMRIKKRPRISLAESINLQKQASTPHTSIKHSSYRSLPSQLSGVPLPQLGNQGPTSIIRKTPVPPKRVFADVLSKSKSWS